MFSLFYPYFFRKYQFFATLLKIAMKMQIKKQSELEHFSLF